MATDDERREVARRLRELEVCEFDGEFIDCGEVENVLGLVSDDGAWYEAEGVTRLADLIEPPRQCPCYDSGRHWCSIHDVPIIDRDALLKVADMLECDGECSECECGKGTFCEAPTIAAARIRKALGAES